MSNLIFGREESDRHDVYFSVINQAHIKMVQLDNRVISELQTLNNDDQESEDFEADIRSALSDFNDARQKLGAAIMRHRKSIGW